MTVIVMSRTEIDRMHVLRDLAAGRITANEAAQLMRLTRPPRVPAGQSVSGAWAVGAGFDPPRQAQQPPLSGGAPNGGAGADQGPLRRLRSNPRLREVG